MSKAQKPKAKQRAHAASAERIKALQERATARMNDALEQAKTLQVRYAFDDGDDWVRPLGEAQRAELSQLLELEKITGQPSPTLTRYCAMLAFAQASSRFMAEFAAEMAAQQPRAAAKALRPKGRDRMRAAIVAALRVRRIDRDMTLKQAMSDLEHDQSSEVQLEPVSNAPTVLVRWRGETRSVTLRSFDTYWRDARK